MNYEKPKQIEDMDAGELELALFIRLGSRRGGVHMGVYTVFAIIIFWSLHWWLFYWLGAIWLLITIAAVAKINYEIKEINSRLNDIYGAK